MAEFPKGIKYKELIKTIKEKIICMCYALTDKGICMQLKMLSQQGLPQYHLKQWFNIVKAKVAIYFKNINLSTKPIAIKHTQLIKK